jgi:hypothetical protein
MTIIGILVRVRAMVFNATLNNISAIFWRSVLFVEETGVPGENLPLVTDILYHIMLYRVLHASVGFELTTLVVIFTDCIRSNKPKYHAITTIGLRSAYQVLL